MNNDEGSVQRLIRMMKNVNDRNNNNSCVSRPNPNPEASHSFRHG